MLKKFPQDNIIKSGDIIFYKKIFSNDEYPMVVLKILNDIELYVRWYGIGSLLHYESILRIENFIEV